eukprot:Filipodium_phascolosomae@DN6697_c0_g1_i1.p1
MDETEQQLKKACVIGGLTSGALSAALFHPWDRALYLSLTNERPLLSRDNWIHPFTGIKQSIVGKIALSGLYFPLETLLHQSFATSNLSSTRQSMYAGMWAGCTTATILHPIALVRHISWSTSSQGLRELKYLDKIYLLHAAGGPAVF